LRAGAVTLTIALSLVALPARADDSPELQRMRFIERGVNLTVTTRINKLFDTSAYNTLKSGFVSTVVVQTWVYPKSSTSPIAWTRDRRTVVYDLWDEVYTVRLCEKCKPMKVKYQSEAFKLLTEITDQPVAALADIPYDDIYYLAIRVDLNPVSPETLTEVRRWLSQGTGGGLDRGGVFFGSFVSVFVNPKIAEADRVLRIRSQPFYRPRS
jgi:hypothetical protein